MKMKLCLSKVVGGCRLGRLTNLGRKGIQSMEIPGCLLYTKMGSAPHLTHDNLKLIQDVPVVIQLPLPALAELHEVLEEYKEGTGKFIGMPDSVLYCSLHDPVISSPPGYNTCKSVSVWGSGGRIEMTPSNFMAIQRAIQPDWFQCLSDGDTVGEGISKKRAKKSVDRSLSFLDECLQLQDKSPELQQSLMMGVVEGGDVLEERLRSAKETAKRPVAGFLLDGFQGNAMPCKTKLELLSAVTAELPEDKPRHLEAICLFMQGAGGAIACSYCFGNGRADFCFDPAWLFLYPDQPNIQLHWAYTRLIHGIGRPDEVLDCIERGVDIFESSFPYQVTERGSALSFSFNYKPDPETAVLKENGQKDTRRKEDEKTDKETIASFEINLKEKRYQDDFGPLVNGCLCYCCQNHSRAYVHHLLETKELLAGVLLMMHNFQHYFGFFCSVRDALKEDQLCRLRQIVSMQAPLG